MYLPCSLIPSTISSSARTVGISFTWLSPEGGTYFCVVINSLSSFTKGCCMNFPSRACPCNGRWLDSPSHDSHLGHLTSFDTVILEKLADRRLSKCSTMVFRQVYSREPGDSFPVVECLAYSICPKSNLQSSYFCQMAVWKRGNCRIGTEVLLKGKTIPITGLPFFVCEIQ